MTGRKPLAKGFLAAALLPPVYAEPLEPQADGIHARAEGATLRGLLRKEFSRAKALSYAKAREAMYREVDNYDGEITLVYTGEKATLDGNGQPPGDVNCEHVNPQSYFRVASGRTDIHNLKPARVKVNSARSNKPFADIPDRETESWYKSARAEGLPREDIDAYSESTRKQFEPREADKGDIARAMIYVYVIYDDGIDKAWAERQMPTLLQWHRQDPIHPQERERSEHIRRFQGNHNPFVLDPSLAERALRDIVGHQGDNRIMSIIGVRRGRKEDMPHPLDYHDPRVNMVFLPAGEALRLMRWPDAPLQGGEMSRE